MCDTLQLSQGDALLILWGLLLLLLFFCCFFISFWEEEVARTEGRYNETGKSRIVVHDVKFTKNQLKIKKKRMIEKKQNTFMKWC